MNVEEIKHVLIDQRESLEWQSDKKIIERENLKEYKKFLSSTLIKIIIGPRRTGKSVLSLQLLENKKYAYVNFDDERLSDFATKDLDMILQSIYELYDKPEFIFFDEIQNIKGWELFVNRLKRLNFNLIITGSNAKLLSSELATHLTGRHLTLELLPFSFREYLGFHEFDYNKNNFSTREIAVIKKFLNKYIEFGGFPEVVQGENPNKYLSSLFSTILSKDILARKNLKYSKSLKDTAFYLLSNYSCRHTFNKIKNIFNYKSIHTAENYFMFLEESYLIFSLNRFSYKIKESITAPRKIYSIDTGLVNTLSVKNYIQYGLQYENIVAIELKRKIENEDSSEIYYWANNSDLEVDFLIKKRGKVNQLIQVCYDLNNIDTYKREVRALLKASEELHCNELLIITSEVEKVEKTEGKKISIIPLWKWLLKK
jgi:uncharacterized protein